MKILEVFLLGSSKYVVGHGFKYSLKFVLKFSQLHFISAENNLQEVEMSLHMETIAYSGNALYQ